MKNWHDLEEFVSGLFLVSSRSEGVLRILFSFEDGRSQIAIIERISDDEGREFAAISSPFSESEELPWPMILRRAQEWVVGGVAMTGTVAVVRHAVPLAHLDPEELLVPLQAVATCADLLEEEFGGGDRF